MAIQKNITIDGIEVPFKASAAVPRLYRLKFRRDIYKDFGARIKSRQPKVTGGGKYVIIKIIKKVKGVF